MSPWLHGELTALGPMVLFESRQTPSALPVQCTKTDERNVRALGHLARPSRYRPVKVERRNSQTSCLSLGHRPTLKRKLLDIENEIRHSLMIFGLPLEISSAGTSCVADIAAFPPPSGDHAPTLQDSDR